jgi:hypothetical protein
LTGRSTAYKSWTERLNRLGGDFSDAQRIQLLRAKVQGTSGRMLNGAVAGNAYNAAQEDEAGIVQNVLTINATIVEKLDMLSELVLI